MSLLQEATFERLLPRYERVFGGPPPLRSATLDEVVAHMRDRLRSAEACDTRSASKNITAAGFPRPGTAGPESRRRPVH